MDRELQDLARLLAADPSDEAAWTRYDRALLRAHDRGSIDLLRDIERWRAAEAGVQDLEIARIGALLDDDGLAHTRTTTCTVELGTCTECGGVGWQERYQDTGWTDDDAVLWPTSKLVLAQCEVCRRVGTPPNEQPRVRSTRVATFRHAETGIELNLLPGKGDLAPFLLGRTVITAGQYGAVGDPDLPLVLYRGMKLRARSPSERSWGEVEGWLGQRGLRLPSTREWWHALHAGPAPANYPRLVPEPPCKHHHPHPVTRFADAPDGLGLLELEGNLFEVTMDDDPSRPPAIRGGWCRLPPGSGPVQGSVHLIGARAAASLS